MNISPDVHFFYIKLHIAPLRLDVKFCKTSSINVCVITVSFVFLSQGGTSLKRIQHNSDFLRFFFFSIFLFSSCRSILPYKSPLPSPWLRSLDQRGPSPATSETLPPCPRNPSTSFAPKPAPAESALTSGAWTTRSCGGPWTVYPEPDSASSGTATPTSPWWRSATTTAWTKTSTSSTGTRGPSPPSWTFTARASCTWWRRCAPFRSGRSWTTGGLTRSTWSPAARPATTRKRSRWMRSWGGRPRQWGRGRERASLITPAARTRGRSCGISWRSPAPR